MCIFETSALNGDNIDKGFEMMVSDIFKKFEMMKILMMMLI